MNYPQVMQNPLLNRFKQQEENDDGKSMCEKLKIAANLICFVNSQIQQLRQTKNMPLTQRATALHWTHPVGHALPR